MDCEVVAIGTELLLGQVVDTNSAWIGDRLADAGIACYEQVKVGDNHGRIVAALRAALARADAVICCGGLGPTQDDITREAIAEVMGVDLRRDPEIEVALKERFRYRDVPVSNYKQADVPEGATPVRAAMGTAPGLICPVGDKVIYAVPGVPVEMRDMVAHAIVPDLVRRAGPLPPLPKGNPSRLIEIMGSDKKTRGGKLRFVLPRSIGHVETVGGLPTLLVWQVLADLQQENSHPARRQASHR